MKKFSAIVAALSVVFAGLTATAASATGFTPNENSNVVGAYWTDNIPTDGVFGIPASPKRFSLSKRWGWSGTKIDDILSQEIDFTWSLTMPNGTVVNSNNAMQYGFNASADGNLQGNGAYRNFMGSGPTLALTPTPVVGDTYTSAEVSFGLQAYNASQLAAGNYTLALSIFVDGNLYTDFTTSGPNSSSVISSSYYITGNKALGTSVNVDFLTIGKTQIQNTTCINTEQIQAGDQLTIRRIVDGNVVPAVVSGVDRSIYASLATPGAGSSYVNTSMDQDDNITFTTTQDMVGRGVKIESYLEYLNAAGSDPDLTADNSLSAGSHTVGVSITKADGTEVTNGCFPPAPATPTVSISGQSVSASATGSFLSSSEATYVCQAYKASDNTTIGSEAAGYTTGWSNGAATTVSCNNIYGITGGTTFYVKLIARSAFYGGWESRSSASLNATLPASGVTITTTASNGTSFGNVKALPSIDLITLTGSGTQSTAGIAEPTGGVFEFTKNSSNVAIRHITTTGLDTTFGTKTFATPYQSANMTFNFHGTVTAPKPFALFSSQAMSPEVTIKEYNFDGTTGSTRVLTNSQLTTLCTSEFGNTFGTVGAAYGVSSPTTDVYFQVACSTGPGINPQTGYMLAKVNISGTAAPESVTKLGTPTAENTSFQTQGSQIGMSGLPTSVNWTATGSTPMLTFIALPYKPGTCNPSCSATYTGTAKVVRITSAGAALTQATAGIENTDVAGATLSVSMSTTNFGEILATRRVTVNVPTPSTVTSFVKLGASGNGSAFTPTWDESAGQPNATSGLGSILGKTADGQAVMLRSANVAGVNTLKMVKVNFSTGAVTSFGEAYAYTSSGAPAVLTAAAGVNGFLFLATSAVHAGKMDVLLGVGGGATVPVAPTVPVPVGDANTDLGKSLNAGGTKFVITGTLLTAVSGITFNGVALPSSKFVKTATKLTITVPAGTTGTVAVALVHAGGSIPVGDWEYTGATKRSQTLTPTGLGDPTYAGAGEDNRNFTVASNLSGYAVVVTSKSPTVCTYVSGVIDFVGNGTCTLQAVQAGDAVTNAASVTYEIYYESTIVPSTLYSTDAGQPTITITGEGLNSVSKVVFGNVEVTPTKKTATSITVKVPAAPTPGANVDIDLKYTNGTVVETPLTFDYVGATKLSQAVTLVAGFSQATYGDAARTLSASSTTADIAATELPGLPYVYTTSTGSVCAISGDQLRFLTAGTCTVKANQAGNAGVIAASSAEFTITVALKSQTITVDDSARTITDVEGANLEATNSNSEVLLEYTSSDELICTVDGEGTVTGLAAGTCTITINAPADARYSAATQESVVITVDTSATQGVDAPADAADVVDEEPISVTNGGANSFISLSDPSLQVSWDKANGKLTPRATGVYTGYIVAELRFTAAGVNYVCTNVFGATSKLTNPKKPTAPVALGEGATAKQIAAFVKAEAAYVKALAAYKIAYNKVWGTKVFASKNFCADTNKIKGATAQNPFGTSFATAVKAAKSSAEKKLEGNALKALKNFTGNVTITVKRWRAWPTTMKNKAGNAGTGKTISATKNVNTLTLG